MVRGECPLKQQQSKPLGCASVKVNCRWTVCNSACLSGKNHLFSRWLISAMES